MRKSCALLLVPAMVLTACGGTGTGGTTGAHLAAAPADMQAIYKKQCMSCHGTDLQDKLGARSDLQTVGARRSRDEIKDAIVNGRPSMVPFKSRLKPEEIDRLADWLAGLK